MEFYGLNRDEIKHHSVLENGYYIFKLGKSVEVTAMKKNSVNNVLSKCLSYSKKEDKLMVKYSPSNKIYFDKDFIDDDTSLNLASCMFDVNTSCVKVGKLEKYEISSGALVLSGVLSANDLVESQRLVYSNSQLSAENTKEMVTIFSLSVLGDSLFGIFFIPKIRGLAISSDTSANLAYSVKTGRLEDYSSWNKYSIEDWFEGSKIKELE